MRHEMIRHHARDVVGLQEKRRALAKHHWDLMDKILGAGKGLPEGELVVLGGPSKRKSHHMWSIDKEKSVTIVLPGSNPRGKFIIHRTHADRSPTIQAFIRGEGMERYGEEPTVPGVQPAEPEPTVFTKDEPVPAHEVPCPRIVNAPMEKGTRCYLCARQLDYFFERTPGDYSKICSSCVYSQLGYDIGNNGQLKRRPEEKPIK